MTLYCCRYILLPKKSKANKEKGIIMNWQNNEKNRIEIQSSFNDVGDN